MAFAKGQSGNPNGRPRGFGKVEKIRLAIQAEMPAVLATLIDAAKAGDVAAAKVLLDKICPSMKAREEPVLLNFEGASLVEKGNAILQAAGRGELPPDAASQLLSALAGQAKLIEVEELEQRIAALESANGQSQAPR